MLDVDAVILGGGVSAVGSPWLGPLENAYRDHLMDVVADTPLLPAAAGGDAALLGAAASAVAML